MAAITDRSITKVPMPGIGLKFRAIIKVDSLQAAVRNDIAEFGFRKRKVYAQCITSTAILRAKAIIWVVGHGPEVQARQLDAMLFYLAPGPFIIRLMNDMEPVRSTRRRNVNFAIWCKLC
ncbi:hypothetical protein IX84_26305 [Phaeodactylibacter xiamenensis]|uniref:Uncharacterized protein n=1 Tax=Phaeodactylibacter xiamenensis TaxID=1524460 RepID=A0A098S179_9BACT|nr:hypothetical protein IX84_26305 [Phaeodactylibacter xiamenensis]